MPTVTRRSRRLKAHGKNRKVPGKARRARVSPVKLELDAEEIALHNAITAATARALAR